MGYSPHFLQIASQTWLTPASEESGAAVTYGSLRNLVVAILQVTFLLWSAVQVGGVVG